MNKPYRLGLDLGTNSIGWTILDLSAEGKPIAIRRMGSRIFSDGRNPKSGQSLAISRTSVRGQRTRRDRAKRRRDALILTLRQSGLLPQDMESARNLASRDPYELRARAATKPIDAFLLGRALMHLAKRRGFQSNRRTPAKDAEGNTKEAMKRLHEQLEGKTLGQFLHEQISRGLGARFRPSPESAGKPKKDFPLYPERAMYRAEFAVIRSVQEPHHMNTVSAATWDRIDHLIFHQRDLKTPERGKCRFIPGESRASIALPSFQQFRLLSDANHLGYKSDAFGTVQMLDVNQRAAVLALTRTQKTASFSKLRTKLKLDDEVRFNLESDKRDKLLGDEVGTLFSGKNLFGARWHDMDLAERDAIVSAVLDLDDLEALRAVGAKQGLAGDGLDEFCRLTPDDLPKGTARFSAKALRLLVPQLAKGLKYNEAVEACGWPHTITPEDGSAPELPYYGKAMPDSVVPSPKSKGKVEEEYQYGRFPNPTVHIALNQLRLVVNSLIARYGKPAEINLEIARDLKMSAAQREELLKEQAKNTKANDRRNAFIEEINAAHGARFAKNYDNRLRLRLWEELADDVNCRCCPYTGQRITPAKLFSDEIEIDHILPFGATCDDSPANKTLCLRSANREKRKRSPYEAFGHSPAGYDYDAILSRAILLPGNKRWRFQADAMERFRDDNKFQARQLVDTQHLGRAAHRYLSCITPPNLIRVSPGRITALLRHHWGLDTLLTTDDAPDRIGKNRADHRHHAIDALVVSLLDYRLLKFIRDANAAEDLDGIEVPPPWARFRADATAQVERIVVSHRPDHNPAGSLHEDTFYGSVGQERRRPEQQWELDHEFDLVYRVGIETLGEENLDPKSTRSGCVRDRVLREKLRGCLDGIPADLRNHGGDKKKKAAYDKAVGAAFAQYGAANGIRTVRIVKKKASAPLTHAGRDTGRRVIPGQIDHVAFWLMPGPSPRIEAIAADLLTVNRSDYRPQRPASADATGALRPNPKAKKLFVVRQGDCLRTIHKNETKTVIVTSISPANGYLRCKPVRCAAPDTDKSSGSFTIQFSLLLSTQTRPLHISPIGDVRDPRPLQ
ncbi:MAG: type II CRISPR RNA-guided endonuclease Cas9 [Opitutaceae bacterium]|nr:type II CRISPR RNA-guided endonuclease Cas9 [Opitutaceae bacterium]